MKKAILFDRDATLNRTTQILRAGQKDGDKTDGYVLAREELVLFPAVQPALTLLKEKGLRAHVFTQQNCIGKGLVTEEGVSDIHIFMNALLAPDAHIESFHLAWNVPGEPESPRAKPNPTLILEILSQYGYTPEDVIAVGDSMRDYKCALNAGVDFAWIRDDLKRVSEDDMQATGCAIYDNVLQFVKNHTL